MQRSVQLRSALAALVIAAFATGSAFGQQSKPVNRPIDEDPYARDRAMPRHDPYDTQRDFPSTEVRGAVDAHARAAFARAQYHRLQDLLNSSIREMQYGFEHSAELVDAQKAEQQAWNDYVSARREALRPVREDPKWQSNMSLRDSLSEKIADRRGDDHPDMRQIVALATVKLDYAQVARDMEVAALKSNTQVTDARSKLMAAGARVQSMKDDFDKKVRSSTQLADIRKSIDDARIQFITAEAYRDGAVDAANEALDYAYYKNRFSSSYAGYGAPYGYGYPMVGIR